MLKFKAVAHMLKMTTEKLVKPPDTPEAVRKLLQPVESLEIETASTTEGSDVEDVFEDIHRKGYPDPRKSLNTTAKKIKANQVIIEQFTDDHKRTMAAVLQNDKEAENDFLGDIMVVFEGPRVNYEPPQEFLEKISAILNDPDLTIECSPRQVESRKLSTMSYDYMSGVWNMLEAERNGKSFNATPHNFDIYKQDEPHWLERPNLSQEILNMSKEKCEKWLNDQQQI